MHPYLRFSILAVPLAVLGAACGSSDTSASGATRGYSVTIRETSYGIPHVLGKGVPDALAGLGYVGARDYGCILLDQIVRVRGERSKYFGLGANGGNVESDFGMLAAGIREGGARGLAAQSADLRASIDGYVAGFNYYLAHEKLSTQCDGKAWVRPLTAPDLFAYYYWLAQLGSIEPLLGAMAAAGPPGAQSAPRQPQSFPAIRHSPLGSNGWALGRDKTASGKGMLLANPHFPWEGNRKFYENQITVPGVLNVYGASLLGAPIINIGFNEQVAWTHTVTTARHFTLYRLTLAPGDATSYLYDGSIRAMTTHDYGIQVLNPDGTMSAVSRTMYASHYGPMVSIDALGGWSPSTAYSFRNANEDNFSIVEQWHRMNQAKGLDDLQRINAEVQGIPWVNTMAVDAAGTALYMDASRTPNLSDAALQRYRQALLSDTLTQGVDAAGATLLDGSDSTFEWQDGGAKSPGIVPFSQSPVQQRDDFVFNANDSYWLTNPAAPLTGYSPLFGSEATPRSPRTRMNAFYLTEAKADGVAGADGKFTLDELAQVEFSDRESLAELLADQVVARCTGKGPVPSSGKMMDISGACDVLRRWDRRFKLESIGAVLWREFLAGFSDATLDHGALFAEAFDPNDPVATPRSLASAPSIGDDPVLVALAHAVSTLETAGLTATARLGDVQHTRKNGDTIPIHGGLDSEGAFNVVDYGGDSGTLLPSLARGAVLSPPTGLTSDGYLINVGSSFMMVLEFGDSGPHAQAVLSYSESSDPDSSHFEDQTQLFSASQYRPVLFTEQEIAADPNLRVLELTIP